MPRTEQAKAYHREYQKKWRLGKADYYKNYYKRYYLENKEAYNTRYRQREKEDPNFLIANRLRARLRKAIKNDHKVGSAVGELGCSIPELKERLENKFQIGMSWDNYGEWHIDHIIPLSSFDLTNKEQFLEACHYTNLQPLWAKDNLVKNNKR